MTDEELKKIRVIVKEEISASEKRLIVRVNESSKKLTSEIVKSEERLIVRMDESDRKVMTEIGEFIEKQILPEIEKKADKSDIENLATKIDIERLERKLDHYSDKITEHGSRLNDLETLPIIAHELKAKKKK